MSTPETASVTVTVDGSRCVGSATCTTLAPGSFVLDEYDRSSPTPAAATDAAGAELAQSLCPTGAIRVVPAQPAAD
jgi:ferredoxin